MTSLPAKPPRSWMRKVWVKFSAIKNTPFFIFFPRSQQIGSSREAEKEEKREDEKLGSLIRTPQFTERLILSLLGHLPEPDYQGSAYINMPALPAAAFTEVAASLPDIPWVRERVHLLQDAATEAIEDLFPLGRRIPPIPADDLRRRVLAAVAGAAGYSHRNGMNLDAMLAEEVRKDEARFRRMEFEEAAAATAAAAVVEEAAKAAEAADVASAALVGVIEFGFVDEEEVPVRAGRRRRGELMGFLVGSGGNMVLKRARGPSVWHCGDGETPGDLSTANHWFSQRVIGERSSANVAPFLQLAPQQRQRKARQASMFRVCVLHGGCHGKRSGTTGGGRLRCGAEVFGDSGGIGEDRVWREGRWGRFVLWWADSGSVIVRRRESTPNQNVDLPHAPPEISSPASRISSSRCRGTRALNHKYSLMIEVGPESCAREECASIEGMRIDRRKLDSPMDWELGRSCGRTKSAVSKKSARALNAGGVTRGQRLGRGLAKPPRHATPRHASSHKILKASDAQRKPRDAENAGLPLLPPVTAGCPSAALADPIFAAGFGSNATIAEDSRKKIDPVRWALAPCPSHQDDALLDCQAQQPDRTSLHMPTHFSHSIKYSSLPATAVAISAASLTRA
ncbi:hypothetical protein DFJ73DRAFT_944675 [Zopfochytrium polystomum]|nr:hypothetical protein DFJ73DRAFT_944675 [Zopfochytrium polystomum]